MWMVRNDGGQYAEEFVEQGIAAVGWKEVGSLAGFKSREAVIELVKKTWPSYKRMKAVVSGSQLNKIANVMKVGDGVITYDPSKRIYHIGKITGDYQFSAEADDAIAHRRPVKWTQQIERDRLSVPTKNSLGSTLTVFEVPEKAEREIADLLAGRPEKTEAPEPDTAARKFDFIDFYDYCVKQHGEFEAMQILEAVEYAAEAERRRAQLQMSRQDRMREAMAYLSEVWTDKVAA